MPAGSQKPKKKSSKIAKRIQDETDPQTQAMETSQGPQKNGTLPSSDFQEACDAYRPGKVRCDPPGTGTWFKRTTLEGKRPLDQMVEHAKKHGHKFKTAFDYRPYDKVKKMFASYPTWEDFLSNTLLKANPEDRHFYEVIPETEPCKFYLDVEWKGPADPARKVLHHLMDALSLYVKVRHCFRHKIFVKIICFNYFAFASSFDTRFKALAVRF